MRVGDLQVACQRALLKESVARSPREPVAGRRGTESAPTNLSIQAQAKGCKELCGERKAKSYKGSGNV